MLEVLYRETGGANWRNDFNWRNDAPLNIWAGVTTGGGRVVQLELGNGNLTGEIPEELGSLPKLRKLSLRGNALSGCIPYNRNLRNALFNSYNSGRGPGVVPGWHRIIWQALIDTMTEEVGLESVRSPWATSKTPSASSSSWTTPAAWGWPPARPRRRRQASCMTPSRPALIGMYCWSPATTSWGTGPTLTSSSPGKGI